MRATRVILIVLAFILLAAHFSRAGTGVVAGLMLVFPLLLFVRRVWTGWVLKITLLLGGLEWLRTLSRLVAERRVTGDDWARLAVILLAVALVTFLAAWAVRVTSGTAGSDGD
jgi:hypothetical protein